MDCNMWHAKYESVAIVFLTDSDSTFTRLDAVTTKLCLGFIKLGPRFAMARGIRGPLVTAICKGAPNQHKAYP